MCTSTLHQVVALTGPDSVMAEDVDGTRHVVSLLALEPPAPALGEWLVVHSGYAIGRADRDEADAALAELRTAGVGVPGRPGDRR